MFPFDPRILAAVLLAAAPPAPRPAGTIAYTMAPVLAGDSLAALEITLRFRGDADGETVLRLPDRWGGRDELYAGLRDLAVDGATLDSSGAPSHRTLRHAPGAPLAVRYRVVPTWPGEPAVTGGNEYRPVIRGRYFHVIGETVFAYPEAPLETPATFAWRGQPRGWTFASDLEHAPAGPHRMLGELLESVAVGGDFRVVRRGRLRVAIRGAWGFSDQAFVAKLAPILRSHHAFWGEREKPFLVTVLPLRGEPGQFSTGGTGRGDAFAFQSTGNVEEATLTRTLAHEHLHAWIPRRLGAMPALDEAAGYWLSEGFTDFYTLRLLLRDGLWTPGQFVEAVNGVLRAYAMSPVRTEPNARIVADFWKDPAVRDLPYQRGFLLAMLWDQALREASGGARDLDDVVHAMRAEADAASGPPPPATDLLRRHARAFGLDVAGDLERHVERGEAIRWPAALFGPGATVATSEVAAFDRGFDPQRTAMNGNVVTGLRPDSPAFRAGLRDGMKILKRESGTTGDSRVPLRYRVLDGGAERVIEFLPEGTGRLTLQELRVDAAPDAAAHRALVARWAGTAPTPAGR